MTRAEKVEIAQAMRDAGATGREIAAEFGVGVGTVRSWFNDPDLSKHRARLRRYQGSCIDCGAPTDGHNGPGKAPHRCLSCHSAHARDTAYWTRGRIVQAIQDYARRYGRPPSAEHWEPYMARKDGRDDIAQRFYTDACWPALITVRRRFGRWNDAIRAAGFEPLSQGHKHKERAA